MDDIKCSCTCDKKAVAWCQWGSDALGTQEANLCQEHLDNLWENLNPLLKTNSSWFRIDSPKEGKS